MTSNLTYFSLLILKVDFITIFLFLEILGQNHKILKNRESYLLEGYIYIPLTNFGAIRLNYEWSVILTSGHFWMKIA